MEHRPCKRKIYCRRTISCLRKRRDRLLIDAQRLAEARQKELIAETKKEISTLRQAFDKEVKERKQELQDLEKKLDQRDARLDNRSINLDKREESLAKKEQKLEEQRETLEKRSNRVEELILEQETKLFEIASLTMDEARTIVFERVENEIQMDVALFLKEQEEKAKSEAKRKAQTILANAIQQYANETVQEKLFPLSLYLMMI